VGFLQPTGCLVPGAWGFGLSRAAVKGRTRLGAQAFADSMLVVPKTLSSNSGLDPQDAVARLLEEVVRQSRPVGLDLASGETCVPVRWYVLRDLQPFLHYLWLCNQILLLRLHCRWTELAGRTEHLWQLHCQEHGDVQVNAMERKISNTYIGLKRL